MSLSIAAISRSSFEKSRLLAQNAIEQRSFALQCAEVRLFPIYRAAIWARDNQKCYRNRSRHIHPFLRLLAYSILLALPEPTVLDIGCQFGVNCRFLAKSKISVTALDIAPNALTFTLKSLQRRRLQHWIRGTFNESIERFSERTGSYTAVVATTFALSYVLREEFDEVMKRVFGIVKELGFFVGSFYGDRDPLALFDCASTLSTNQIERLFVKNSFSIIQMREEEEQRHIYHVFARKIGSYALESSSFVPRL